MVEQRLITVTESASTVQFTIELPANTIWFITNRNMDRVIDSSYKTIYGKADCLEFSISVDRVWLFCTNVGLGSLDFRIVEVNDCIDEYNFSITTDLKYMIGPEDYTIYYTHLKSNIKSAKSIK